MTYVQVRTSDQAAPLLSFPENRYPTGWFQVCWSDDLAPLEVRSLRYFGQDLVAWRGQSGQVYVLDAYCLHFGANLAVKGTVDGEDIVCPWHGWHWDGGGCNTAIPYDTQACKKNLRIQSWPVREWYGQVLVWHDQAARGPLWEPIRYPELDSGDWYELGPDTRQVFRVRAHVQNVAENAADPAHIVYVHGAATLPEYAEFRFDDHRWTARIEALYGGGKKATSVTPDGPVSGAVELAHVGLGQGHSRWYRPLFPLLMLGNTTPVDDQHVDMFIALSTERVEGEERPAGLGRTMIDHQLRTVQQDFFTWENMKVLDKPSFTPLETKLWTAYRRFCQQFYPETDPRLVDGRPVDSAAWRYTDVVIGQSD